MTLRKALEPPDPGGADSDPLLGSLFCWLQLRFFCCLLQKPSLEDFLGCLTNQGAAEVVCLPQAAGQLPFLVLEMGFVHLAGQQKSSAEQKQPFIGCLLYAQALC